MTSPGPLHALFAEATLAAPDARELAWYRQQFPVEGGLVLDAGCGIGRVLVPLVADGRKVHGVEPAAALLARCTARLAAIGADTPTFRQALAQMNLPFRYGGACLADGALQALAEPAGVQAALERIRAHLVDPGTLVIDCRVPPVAHQRLAAPLVEVRTAKLADGTQIAVRSESTWAPAAGDEALEFVPDAAPSPRARGAGWLRAERRYAHRRGAHLIVEEHEAMRAAWYAPEDMLAIVRAAGFHDPRIAASPCASPADEAFAVIARA